MDCKEIMISIHAPRTGSDSVVWHPQPCEAHISIHAPRTGSDAARRTKCRAGADFNPRSPHGERQRWRTFSTLPTGFQSTLPARGATWMRIRYNKSTVFQSTLPARGATIWSAKLFPSSVFQSTLPARGATATGNGTIQLDGISIHAPRTGSDGGAENETYVTFNISIHAPRTGSDAASGHPLRNRAGISIHAPRTGSDAFSCLAARAYSNFNPRSPHGERPARWRTSCGARRFQSTLPARGATQRHHPRCGRLLYFNPRSPHGERRTDSTRWATPSDFNPRSPHGERPASTAGTRTAKRFQSTLPARGATRCFSVGAAALSHFNPRSPHGERLPCALRVRIVL